MADQQSYADVTLNGKAVDGAVSVEVQEREVRGTTMTMKGPVIFKKRSAFHINLEVVVPDDGSEVDYSDVSDGTLSIEPDGGKATENYRGVYCMKVGQKKNDPENGTTRTVEFMAKEMAKA